jgi:hypothetical protein
MNRPPSRSRTVPSRPGQPPSGPGSTGHEPSPVDLGSESVAGEEDPGASAEPPTSTRSDEPGSGEGGRPGGSSRS